MLIFSEHITTRLVYTCDFIFSSVLNTEYRLLNDPNEFEQYKGVKISYSHQVEGSSFHILPSFLLFDIGIREFQPDISGKGENMVIFPANEGDINFDVFSAVFYFISRYEEYLDFPEDKYGRFTSIQSFASKNNILQIPVVNIWIRTLAKKIAEKFSEFSYSLPPFIFQPTIDIDTAWMVRNKPLYRLTGRVFKNLLSASWQNILLDLYILRRKQKDPFDSYDFILENHKTKVLFFILAGKGRGKDKNIPVRNQEWKELVRKLNAEGMCGLHPSFHSFGKLRLVLKEKSILEKITHTKIKHSRQHFLRFTFPETCRILELAGIENDYSMGFADNTGFRAGTSHPFLFYDLERERMSTLKLFPFVVMDRTLKDYMSLNPEKATDILSDIVHTIKKEGGYFIPVWHNDSLSDHGEWKGWKEVYRKLLIFAEKNLE